MLLDDRALVPLAIGRERLEQSLEVVVPYTVAATAAKTLSAALAMIQGFESRVTLMAVHILPYPAPLEVSEGVRERLAAQLTAVARTVQAAVAVKLVFARDRDVAYRALLSRQSLIVVGTKDHWWRTREERFARKLASHGHSVAVVKVK